MITDVDIWALRAKAAEAGDDEQVAVCDRALQANDLDAWDECERVILAARANAQ